MWSDLWKIKHGTDSLHSSGKVLSNKNHSLDQSITLKSTSGWSAVVPFHFYSLNGKSEGVFSTLSNCLQHFDVVPKEKKKEKKDSSKIKPSGQSSWNNFRSMSVWSRQPAFPELPICSPILHNIIHRWNLCCPSLLF